MGDSRRLGGSEQPRIKRAGGSLNVAAVIELNGGLDAGLAQQRGAGGQVLPKGGKECFIQFPDFQGHFLQMRQGSAGVQGGDPVHHGGGKHAAACAGIQQMQRRAVEPFRLKPSGQAAGNRRWREKLTVLAALFPRLLHAGLPAAGVGQVENVGCGRRDHGFR